MTVELIRLAFVLAFVWLYWESERTKVRKGVTKHGVPYTITTSGKHWRIVYDSRPAIEKWVADSKARENLRGKGGERG